MQNDSTTRAWLVISVLAVSSAALVSFDTEKSWLDDGFNRLRIGMTLHEVESILGSPVPPDPNANRYCVPALDDIDAPPLDIGPYQSAVWYDGVKRRVRVTYVDGKLYDAKINRAGVNGVYLRHTSRGGRE